MPININPFSHLRAQVKSCLEREAKLSPAERRNCQWQFFSTVNDVVYIVGKGGANTMFYMIGQNGERKICSPKEMLDVISSWAAAKYMAYAVCKKPGKFTHGPFLTEDAAKECVDAPVGSFLVGITPDNRLVRLYRLKDGLMEAKWVAFKKKSK